MSIMFIFVVTCVLLLRFDLVFCLLDTKNYEWDRVVSSYILQGKSPLEEMATSRPDTWSFSMLQVYFLIVFSGVEIQCYETGNAPSRLDPEPAPFVENISKLVNY